MERWLFLIAVAGAYFCATQAPWGHRGRAMSVMTAIVITWALYLLSFTTWAPPAALFWAIGIPVTGEHLWALTDLVLGTIVICTAWDRWWGWAIFALLAIQQCFHTAYDWNAIDFGTLSQWLDRTFVAQLACFYVIGGRGAINRVTSLVRLPRRVFRTAGAALRAKV